MMKVAKNIDNNKRELKKNVMSKKHMNYYSKAFVATLLFFTFLLIGIVLVGESISIEKEKKISYTEKSDLDYKVYLKENDFYESEYLGKNMNYIASIIDYIDVDFDYTFFINEQIDGDFNYQIIALLTINNEKSTGMFYSKEYILLDGKKKIIDNGKMAHINEKIKIDYDYYNKLANNFKAAYGVSTTSNLKVYLKVSRNIESNLIENNKFDADNSMAINIPLSEKAISIKMDYNEINNQDSIISSGNIDIEDSLFFTIGVIILILDIILFVDIIKNLICALNSKSSYDKYIEKILREYDRLVVITKTIPNLKEFQIFKVLDFNELLDVRDNLKQPIMYYNVEDHVKSYFYLKNNTDIYLLCIESKFMGKKIKISKYIEVLFFSTYFYNVFSFDILYLILKFLSNPMFIL